MKSEEPEVKNKSFNTETDEDLQQKLINCFVKNNRNMFNEVTAALAAGDIKQAFILVHTLKSNAGQLGKKHLQQAAADIEKQLKNGENNVTPEQIAALELEFNKVMEELTPLVRVTLRYIAEVLEDKNAACELLTKLEFMLKTGNINCLIFIDGLQLIPGSAELIQSIEDYNFKQALNYLYKLREKID